MSEAMSNDTGKAMSDDTCKAMGTESDNFLKLAQAMTKQLEVAVVGGKLSGYLHRMRENGEDASLRAAPYLEQVWPAIFSLTAIAARLVDE
jgi:hypothetical protein